MEGVEVVADDFVVVGYGDTTEAAIQDHDKHLEAFLNQCEERNLKLNDKKIKLETNRSTFYWSCGHG